MPRANKILVRNSLVQIYPDPAPDKNDGSGSDYSSNSLTASYPKSDETDFDVPRLYSSLNIAKAMKNIEKTVPVGPPEPSGYFKVNSVNFYPDELLYHDLVPLNIAKEDLREKRKTHKSLKKDAEPDLKNYVNRKPTSEYTYTTKAIPEPQGKIQIYDGRSLYNKICVWQS